MNIRTLAIALAMILTAVPAMADDGAPIPEQTAQTCGATFPKRLKATQVAIKAAAAFDRESVRVMPWAEAHCRPMTELERALRKENDESAILCDTTQGRPSGLTGKFFWSHANAVQVDSWDPYTAYGAACSAFDPISLDMTDLTFDRGDLQARAAAVIGSIDIEAKKQIIAEQAKAHAGLSHAIAVLKGLLQ